jgi:hypothetical protein
MKKCCSMKWRIKSSKAMKKGECRHPGIIGRILIVSLVERTRRRCFGTS